MTAHTSPFGVSSALGHGVAAAPPPPAHLPIVPCTYQETFEEAAKSCASPEDTGVGARVDASILAKDQAVPEGHYLWLSQDQSSKATVIRTAA